MVAVSRQPGTLQTANSPPSSSVMDQPALRRLIFLHLAPGAVFTIVLIVAAPVLDAWGIDPIFALFGLITWMAWRNRSIFVSIAAHMTINMVAVLGILSAA
jgi:membrane protease YdiL (CAAX protease family)